MDREEIEKAYFKDFSGESDIVEFNELIPETALDLLVQYKRVLVPSAEVARLKAMLNLPRTESGMLKPGDGFMTLINPSDTKIEHNLAEVVWTDSRGSLAKSEIPIPKDYKALGKLRDLINENFILAHPDEEESAQEVQLTIIMRPNNAEGLNEAAFKQCKTVDAIINAYNKAKGHLESKQKARVI